MNARDEWLCPLHPFGHQWNDSKLRCALCGAVRSAGDAIVSALASLRGCGRDSAGRVHDALRAEVLREAAEAADARTEAPHPAPCRYPANPNCTCGSSQTQPDTSTLNTTKDHA